MSPLSYSRTRLRDSSSIVMADAGSFVRVMRCTADIKPVLLSWGSRCCVCASNFPSNLFFLRLSAGPALIGAPDGGEGGGGGLRKRQKKWSRGCSEQKDPSPGLLFESSSGGWSVISHSLICHPPPPPHTLFTTLCRALADPHLCSTAFRSPFKKFLSTTTKKVVLALPC